MNLINIIHHICYEALITKFPHYNNFINKNIEITQTTKKIYGHYQCNSAMKFTKLLNNTPITIAYIIKNFIINKNIYNKIFESIKIIKPGFINFTFTQIYITNFLKKQINNTKYSIPILNKKIKIIIDFSSPNIAKEMHVGHLRSTIIGESISNLLLFLGYKIVKINHLGDWGTQFGMLICLLKHIYKITTKTKLNLTLINLSIYYKLSKIHFDLNKQFKIKSHIEVTLLHKKNPISTNIWKQIYKISTTSLKQIYTLLHIKILNKGESFYNALLNNMVKNLQKKNLIIQSNKAQCVFFKKYINKKKNLLPFIIKKSNESYNYATTDISTIKYRILSEKAQWLIYVTDTGQKLHFNMLFKSAYQAKLYKKINKINHINFGLILKSNGKKFQTRAGKNEKLINLILLGYNKAKNIIQIKNTTISKLALIQTSKKISINSIKYADLSCNPINNYKFNYNKMLNFNGYTASFISYAYARILSIKNNTNIKKNLIFNNIKNNYSNEEWNLSLQICQFSEVISQTIKILNTHKLASYLYDLADKFHIFFHICKVNNSEKQTFRLLLCNLTSKIINKCFFILSLKKINKM
ncbi:MAG: arginine--tRNA ligase [Candidatus Azosocius agrarius]|nr:MAG: arginine--tRNA ligase [Gammaproteobacteria bacterium]